MPRVKVTYELTAVEPFITIESIVFDDVAVADLARDRVNPTPPSYKNNANSDYQIFPDNQFANIKVLASGIAGFSWSMKVTYTILNSDLQPIGTPFTPDTLAEATADNNGNASFNSSTFWKKM